MPRNSAERSQCAAISPSTRRATRPGSGTSSRWQESMKPPSASAISSARNGVRSRSNSSAIMRAISKRRRMGAMAGGRSKPSAPGVNGGSSSSRSPSGRTCGSSTARPFAWRARAAVKARAARRLGNRMVASDRVSGGRSPSHDSTPAARSSRNGRCAGTAYQRGPASANRSKPLIRSRPSGLRPRRAPGGRRRASSRRPARSRTGVRPWPTRATAGSARTDRLDLRRRNSGA